VRRGPYRFIRHPNYALVVLEIAVLPLLLAAPAMAIIFSILNAMLLWWRIRIENDVLAERGRTT
jgi:methyltransferase